MFHKIDKNVSLFRESAGYQKANMVNSIPGGKYKPAGLSQLGYACFWPHGPGAEKERLRSINTPKNGHESGVDGNNHFDDLIGDDVKTKEVDKVCIEVSSD